MAEIWAVRLHFPFSEVGRLRVTTDRVMFVPYRFQPRLPPPGDWPIQAPAAVDGKKALWPPVHGSGPRLRLTSRNGATVWFLVRKPHEVANELQKLLANASH
jgi:hypothetical protein